MIRNKYGGSVTNKAKYCPKGEPDLGEQINNEGLGFKMKKALLSGSLHHSTSTSYSGRRKPLFYGTNRLAFITIIATVALVVIFTACSGNSRIEIADSTESESYEQPSGSELTEEKDTPSVDLSMDNIVIGTWRDEPIEWRVLDRQNGKVLILSNDILTTRQYDGLEDIYGERLAGNNIDWTNVQVTWADSEIREWLNNEFISMVFSENEINRILTSNISNQNNLLFGTNGGVDTEDKVFLLSLDEVNKYFADGKMYEIIEKDGIYKNDDLISYLMLTDSEKNYMLKIAEEDWGYDEELLTVIEERGWLSEIGVKKRWEWWLRSPGVYGGFASFISENLGGGAVCYNGCIAGEGNDIGRTVCGVRPAMWIKAS